MKVCDIVCNSIWYDPRVNRQITEYEKASDVQLCAVGFKCRRYDEEKLKQYRFPIEIVEMPAKYQGKLRNPAEKFKRELVRQNLLCQAIVKFHPDLIHANDLDALIPAVKAAAVLGCRVVFDSHELCAENSQVVGNFFYHHLMRFYEWRYIRCCDLMVCVSHAAAGYFADKYRITEPMVVTNCALQSNVPDKESAKNDGFEVLNHGQFYAGRGYDIMARACDLLENQPQIKLAVRGYGKMEEELREMVSNSKNKDNFHFYPPVTVQELIPMAARSHVGVAITVPICLNFRLSVSNKLFEYAAAGLPVIMSDIPEHRYLNEKYQFGLILKENTPQEFADACETLYRDRQLYQQMSDNAVRMTRELNWETEFAKLLHAERQLCCD